MSIITINLNLSKIPKDKIFDGKQGKYISLTIAERREKDQYGNTHMVYYYDKNATGNDKRTFCGDGKVMAFNNSQNQDELPTIAQQKAEGKTFDDLPF